MNQDNKVGRTVYDLIIEVLNSSKFWVLLFVCVCFLIFLYIQTPPGKAVKLFGVELYHKYSISTPNATHTKPEENVTKPAPWNKNDFIYKVALHKVLLEKEHLTIYFEKNFTTNLYLKTRDWNSITNHGIYKNGQQIKLGNLTRHIFIGMELRACHGNNGNICSDFVRIEGG